MINPRTGMPLPGGMPRWGGQPPMAGQFSEPGVPGAEGMQQGRMRGMPFYGQMHKGGRVKKTGLYKLKKGEHVIPLSRLVKA